MTKPATLTHHQEVSAQCASCGLSALVPVHLQRDAKANWVQVNKVGWFRRNKVDTAKADVQIDACPVCSGAWFDAGELNTLAGSLEGVEDILDPEADDTNRPCPHGHGPMQEHGLPGVIRTPVDRCTTCGGIWLDGHERRKLAKATTSEGQGTRTERWLKRGAIWAAQVLTHLPVEVDNPGRGTPWIVYTLLAIFAVVFGMQEFEQLDTIFYGIVPGRFKQNDDWYTLGTYMFMHGSVPHILGNAYFLYTFGDNIEHLFGHIRFALFFVVTGLLAGVLHTFLTQETATVVVGASGSIAGVLAAYLWAFPRQRLFQVVLWIQIKIPVWVYLLVWVGFHIVMGFFGTGSGAKQVAWFAHLGGFLVGLAITPVMLKLRRHEVARSVRVPAAR